MRMEDEGSQKRFLMGNFIKQDQWETKNKKGRHCPDGHITDPTNTRMEEMSRRQRRTEVSSEGTSDQKGL